MSLNNSISAILIVIMDNNVIITNPSETADTFKNYFAKVARDIQFSIRSSKKCD